MRNIALVRVKYGEYNSPTPAPFQRTGRSLAPPTEPIRLPRMKRQYSLIETLTLVMYSELASGSTGILHRARLEVMADNGSLLTKDVVVKMAFSPEQQERARNEYKIYDHVVSSGVQGCVPSIYGFFEDLEGGATALVMNYVGKSLRQLSPHKNTLQIKASPYDR